MKLPNYVNHVFLALDASSSMSHLTQDVIKVFDAQIAYLAQRSKDLDQETRVSIYLFADKVECLVYDKDVLRLPSIAAHYSPYGNTALLDATLTAIDDLKKTPELYGDHSFLGFVVTDGESNVNNHLSSKVATAIKGLPDNWTVAVFVPDQRGVHATKQFGFPAANIQVWSTDKAGLKEAGNTLRSATESFMQNRAKGIRGTKTLFQVDTSGLSPSLIKQALTELRANEYKLFSVNKDAAIQPFVESWTGNDYVKGSAYYLLTKPETVQAYKQICIQRKDNGKVYSGAAARQLLGLPDTEVKVIPASFGDFLIYAQSTSSNRKLLKGTSVLVLS